MWTSSCGTDFECIRYAFCKPKRFFLCHEWYSFNVTWSNLLDMGPSGLRKAQTLALNESIVVKLGWAWGWATLFLSLSHEFFSLRHTQLNVLHSAQSGQISQATMWPGVPIPQCTNPWLDKARSKGGHSLERVCWGLLWSETCFVSGVPFIF